MEVNCHEPCCLYSFCLQKLGLCACHFSICQKYKQLNLIIIIFFTCVRSGGNLKSHHQLHVLHHSLQVRRMLKLSLRLKNLTHHNLRLNFLFVFFIHVVSAKKKSSTITKIMFCLAALIVIIKDKQCTWSNLY